MLAVILADASELLDSLTHHFAPREPGETPAAFAKRMVGSAAAVYANDDPVLKACAVARNTDAQIREMMDDFYDGIIDKLIALLEQDSEARTDLRRPARAGAHAGGDDDDDADARQRVRRPRRRSQARRRCPRASCGWPRSGVAPTCAANGSYYFIAGIEPPDHGTGRSRGPLTSPIHLLVHGAGRPLVAPVPPGHSAVAPLSE